MLPGAVFEGRFVIERKAGSGTSGLVFRAGDRRTGETVALKILHRSASLARFAEETRILAELRHPGIVRYVAHGSGADGAPWLAMEWIDGEGLDARLSRGPLGVEETASLARRVADALAAAHARGVIHRDLKPSNLILRGGAAEGATIIDFGVARGVAADAALTMAPRGRAQMEAAVGTMGYMAPEQARGQSDLDARADVFSLGCVLFECLSGRPAFAGEHPMAVLAKVLLEEPPRLRESRVGVSHTLDALVMSMLAKNRDDRPGDAAAVVRALTALDLVSGSAPPPPRPRSIGADEQRLLSVALAGPDVARRPPPEGLAATLEALGARMEGLADGSLVCTLAGAASDQAASAARAALCMRAAFPARAVALATGRGVTTGAAAPIGEVIDRAARMLTLAPPWHPGQGPSPIRIDEITAGLLDPRFEVSGDLRGLVLTAERDPAPHARPLLGRATPCVGREPELSLLRDRMESAFAERNARVVLVTGPDGTGKTRLRRELVEGLAAVGGGGVTVILAQGDAASARSPFGLLAPALRRAAGVRDGEPLSVRQQKLRARATRHARDPQEAARVAEFLGEIAGVPFSDEASVALRSARRDPMLMSDQIRRAWGDFLASELSRGPVLLALEDLHWGDVASIRLLDTALRAAREAPLFVLATARPEVHEIFPDLWSAHAVEELPLGPLPREAALALVTGTLGDRVTPELAARLVDRAGGNPFYLEELIRHAARLGVRSSADPLPATVLAMVEAGLATLDPEARRALRAASVLGRQFTREGVLALLGDDADPRVVSAHLAALTEREILTRVPSPSGETYAFRQELVREAAYATLTGADRTLGHRLAAEHLVRRGDGDPATLADHFERGDDPERAAHWLTRAAEQALSGDDFDGVIALAQRGIHAGGAEGPLLSLAAAAHRWRGRNAEAQRAGLSALAALPRGSATYYAAAAEVAVASAKLGDAERLEEIGEALVSLSQSGASGPDHCIACARTATHLLYAGRRDLADALFTALDRATPSGDPAEAARVEQARAIRALYDGDLEQHVARMEASARAFDAAGDLRNAGMQRVNSMFALLEVGAYEEVELASRAAIAGAELAGLPALAALARCNLGIALLALGSRDEARRETARAAASFASQGDRRMEGASRNNLAIVLLSSGDLAGADREVQTALGALAEGSPARAYALATRARVELNRGRAAEALAAAREAMLAALGGIEEGESAVLLVHAEALAATGELGSARTAIAAARARLAERARRIGDPERRRSFLSRVPDNARTLDLARAWTGDLGALD